MRRVRAALAAVATAVAVCGATYAYAAEPVADNPQGATAVVDPSTVVQGGTLSFSGTGFVTNGRGEVVNVRIDDKAILPADISKSDVWATVKAGPDGRISGTLDLSKANASTPILPGRHWIRLLTGSGQSGDTPRTLHADFTVVANPDAPTTPQEATGGGGSTPTTSTPIESKPSEITPNGVVWLTDPVVTRTKTKKKITLKLRAGAVGSAGKVSVRTKNPYKIGKGAAKRRIVAKSTPYFVDRVSAGTINLTLTADALTLLRRKKELKAVVTLVDANGEDTITHDVKIQR